MRSKDRSRFDPAVLRDLAGSTVFERGDAYFRNGTVDLLSIELGRVVARVAGTEEYRTIVTDRGSAIGGECSCPAFERDGFCKHMVAVALAANASLQADTAGSGGTLSRIRDYLRSREVDFLVETIMEVAEREPALLRRLEVAAATLCTDKEFEAQLRGAICNATRTHGFIDYERAADWAAAVRGALEPLADMASGPRAALIVELTAYALSRIERAIDDIEGSDGHCGALLGYAQRIHFDACRTARPDPVALARDLFVRETEEPYDIFYAAAAQYADALGEEGLTEYRRLATQAWEKVPSRVGPGYRAEERYNDFRLTSILDFFAERDGDVEMRIALRAKNLSSPWAFLQLAEFCQAQGRKDEALRRAEEGLWLFEDDQPDERLVFFVVDRLVEARREADAEAHLWRIFEKKPTLSLYRRLRELCGAAAAERAIEGLQRKLSDNRSMHRHALADLLVRAMIEEKMFAAAWNIVRDHGASQSLQEALARASETTHRSEALAVYIERVEHLLGIGGNPAYEEAVALIARMADLHGPAKQATYLAEIRERHRRKRNFMRLLISSPCDGRR